MTLELSDYQKHYNYYDNQFSVKIIADSIDVRRDGKRITTFLLEIPQTVLSHIVRHRVYSFSVSSKRALSTTRLNKAANFIPKMRRKDSRGMQPIEFFDEDWDYDEYDMWKSAKEHAEFLSSEMEESGVAKEISNQLMVPFQIVSVLLTGTDFENLFELRIHKDTQIETQYIAAKMWEALQTNTPKVLTKNEWHIPFYSPDMANLPIHEQLAVSAARCARTSYVVPNTNKNSTIESDISLCKKLLTKPFHASPFEHIATPATMYDLYPELGQYQFFEDLRTKYFGNFSQWVQFRKLIEYTEFPSYLTEVATIGREFRNAIY